VQDEVRSLCGPTGRVVVRTPAPDDAVAALGAAVVARDGATVTALADDPVALHGVLAAAGVPVAEFTVERRTLEDAFLAVTSAGSDRVAGAADEPDEVVRA